MLRLIAGEHAAWGFSLFEESQIGVESACTVSPQHAGVLQRSVATAITADGYSPETLNANRKKPFNLTQTPGVRLALTTLAVSPMRCSQRRAAVLAGIESLGAEECLYWYAQVRGSAGNRALKALRVLLADD